CWASSRSSSACSWPGRSASSSRTSCGRRITMLERLFHRYQLQDPPFYQFLFGNVFMAPIFTVARVYVGWQFLQAGYHKVTGDGWLNQDGSALKGFWERAVAIPQTGSPPIKFDWYRNFLQFMLDHHWYTWFAWIIAFGETIA